MTIKHQNKNISAEKKYVITNVEDNPNGILTFTLTNLYDNSTTTIPIDLSKHKLKLIKVTQAELERIKTSTNTEDIKNRESHIYLVPKNSTDEGVYQELVWMDNDFEILGSTEIDLEPYFKKENVYNGLDYSTNNNTKVLSAYQGYVLNRDKINFSDIIDRIDSTNPEKVLSARQGSVLDAKKVDKETGKGLSEANFTNAEKNKLSNIQPEANKTIIVNVVEDNNANAVSSNAVYDYVTSEINNIVGDIHTIIFGTGGS